MKIIILILSLSFFAHAQEELTLQDLKKQLDELSQKIEKKEEKKISFFGDFRLRHQMEKTAPQEQRTLERFQLKLGAKVDLSETLQVQARLMTGTSANSGNITMGDNKSSSASRRSIGVDWAFMSYVPFDFLSFQLGKGPSPFYFVGKNQLILDRDISPEGIAIKAPYKIDDEWSLNASALASWNVENFDSSAGLEKTDAMFNGIQGYLQWKKDKTSALVGAGSFAFTKVRDMNPGIFTGGAVSSESRGNTTYLDVNSSNQVYQYNYDLSEVFFEIKHKIDDWELSAFSEVVENINVHGGGKKATSDGFGVQYKKLGATYVIEKVRKDSVFALFTDSDFAAGTTASKGSILQLSYKATSNATWTVTKYENRINLDTIPVKYDRLHLDFNLSF